MDLKIPVHGQCHCGEVQFRAVARKAQALECNCSICSMSGFVHIIVGAKDFELIQGDSALSCYRFNTQIAEHTFCSHCGVKPFYRPRSHPEGFSVNWRCIPVAQQQKFTIVPFNGQAWEASVHKIR